MFRVENQPSKTPACSRWLEDVFRQNSYNDRQICKIFYPLPCAGQPIGKPDSNASSPMQGTVLTQHQINGPVSQENI
jgi:hypothetical protein